MTKYILKQFQMKNRNLVLLNKCNMYHSLKHLDKNIFVFWNREKNRTEVHDITKDVFEGHTSLQFSDETFSHSIVNEIIVGHYKNTNTQQALEDAWDASDRYEDRLSENRIKETKRIAKQMYIGNI